MQAWRRDLSQLSFPTVTLSEASLAGNSLFMTSAAASRGCCHSHKGFTVRLGLAWNYVSQAELKLAASKVLGLKAASHTHHFKELSPKTPFRSK